MVQVSVKNKFKYQNFNMKAINVGQHTRQIHPKTCDDKIKWDSAVLETKSIDRKPSRKQNSLETNSFDTF